MTERPRLPQGYRLVAFERLTSTNAVAKRRAAKGEPDGTVILARRQSAGRGRRGRDWASPPGNLYLSLILRPDCALAVAAQLSLVAAVAAAEALKSLLPATVPVQVKWPNDILANGLKAGGILLESSAQSAAHVDWLVIGLGINVESHPLGTEFPATSLRAAGGGAVTVEMTWAAFLACFVTWSARWRSRGFAPIRKAWLERAWKRGEAIEARVGAERVPGILRDLDKDGSLVLELSDGARRRITAADVFALPAT